MSRRRRPPFDGDALRDLRQAGPDRQEALNRLIFEYWCDDTNRRAYLAHLNGRAEFVPSRAPLQIDPAPPLTEPTPQGFRDIVLLSRPDHVRQVLENRDGRFTNAPYAALGGASFLLGLEPGVKVNGVDWHAQQQLLVKAALDYPVDGLRQAALAAVDQAALTVLTQSDFDLALLAEQATLRYLGLLFGYALHDHPLLEDTARATYRALQYLVVGQHFVTEPGTLPAAQQALGRLIDRSSELMQDYVELDRFPREHGSRAARRWPADVQPWSELGLAQELSEGPVLKRMAAADGLLNGRDRAIVAATLLAGTVGNIQSAVCLLVQSLLHPRPSDAVPLQSVVSAADAVFEHALGMQLAQHPPLPVLPRRTGPDPVELDGLTLKPETDCLVLLESAGAGMRAHQADRCPRVWGALAQGTTAPHACLGQFLSMPLIAALVRYTARLPGLAPALDPLTAEPLEMQRLWGFGCTRYPLRHEREQRRVQHNLIASMRLKTPISDSAAALRRLIAAAVPRIEHVLNGFAHVHFAWFEFSDDDTRLVLRTVYDGQFDAYIRHFALSAGDLFDRLFEHLEDAPPRPVAEHPREFMECIRRHNRAPLAGYLYSAYPATDAVQRQRPGA